MVYRKFTILGNVLFLLLLSGSVGYSADGEGSARIISPANLVAGSSARVTIEFETGPSGIPVGGGVILAVHHAAEWFNLQVKDPNKPGYMTVNCETPDNSDTAWYEWPPAGTIAETKACLFSDAMFHQCMIARVKNQPLKPGERVVFVIGANEHKALVPKAVDTDHEFRIMTDVDGDGVFKGISLSPKLDIIAAPADHFTASAPSVLVAGERFELQIRVEDQFFNLATDYNNTVTVRDEDGTILMAGVPVSKGMTRIQLCVSEKGPRRFRLSDGKLKGRSNPCRAFETAPERRIYWGDMHGHSIVSDGLGDSAGDYFAFGKDVADLDVCALTDHGHYDWSQSANAVKKFYEPGRYVTILGQEIGSGVDHINLLFRRDNAAHIKGWPNYKQMGQAIYEQYNTESLEAIYGLNHFAYNCADEPYPFGLFDSRTAPRYVEVYSSQGTSEYLNNPRPFPTACNNEKYYMQAGLAKGHRFGVIGTSDNHDSHPGRSIWSYYPGGLTAFYAKELTREAIWEAFLNYHVYATSFDRIYIEFSINGHGMGEEVTADGSCTINYYVIGKTDNIEVFLIRNNEQYRLDRTQTGIVDVEFHETPPKEKNFYYLRVVQDNGERAWSTPIWVR